MKRKGLHSRGYKLELLKAKKEYRESIKKAKENCWEERINEINKAKDISKWWIAINKFRKRKSGKGSSDNKISGKKWIRHFRNLLNK